MKKRVMSLLLCVSVWLPLLAVGAQSQCAVKIIKMDSVEKKIGLSIKAALDEPDDNSLHAYQQSQQGDGGATLGDVLGDDVLRHSTSDEDDDGTGA